MCTSKVKTLVIVFALFLFAGLVTVGCKDKTKNAWVNTNSLPGKTFSHNINSAQPNNSAIVYLGSDNKSKSKFGPKDVNFEFENLR